MSSRVFEVVATVRVTYEIPAETAAEAEADLSKYLDNPSQVLDLLKVEETIDMEDHNRDR
jgi:hypothetical protein